MGVPKKGGGNEGEEGEEEGSGGLEEEKRFESTYLDRNLVKEKKKFLLEIGATRTWISVDRLKPHTGTAAPAVAQLPSRGRPRKL